MSWKQSINLLMMSYITALIIFALPGNVAYANVIGLAFAGTYALYKVLHRDYRVFMPKVILVYLAFVLFLLSSCLWSDSFGLSFEQSFLNIKVFIILFIISNAMIELENVLYVFYGVLLGMLVNYLVYFHLWTPPYETWVWVRFMGTTGNPNVLAIVSIFSIFSTIMIILLKQLKNIYLLAALYANLVLSVYMIIATASKKGVLFGSLLVFGYLVSLLKNRKQFFRLTAGALAVLVLVVPWMDFGVLGDQLATVTERFSNLFASVSGQGHETSSADRLRFITEGFWQGADQPFIGHGINTFRLHFGLYAHNNFIELFFGVGIIGLLLYYAMYGVLLKSVTRIRETFVRYMSFGFVAILLLMDIALVSYYFKLLLIMLVAVAEVAKMRIIDDVTPSAEKTSL